MRNKRELEQLSDRVLERTREDALAEACVAPRSSAVAFRQGEREDTSQPFFETAVVFSRQFFRLGEHCWLLSDFLSLFFSGSSV